MLKVDLDKWGQSAAELRELSLCASHPRSRERLMALYEICGGKSATAVGRDSGRNPQTVMEWVHRYNEQGSEALVYRRTGGHPPLPALVQAGLEAVIYEQLEQAAQPPQAREQAPSPRWTLKRLVQWVKSTFEISCSRETLRQTLKRLGFSWKKARKLLNKADPAKRKAFLQSLEGLLEEALHQQCLLVYIDEAHLHLDTDEGYGWSICGKRFWVSSSSPGRAKVSFYGIYLYDVAQVRIWPYDRANGELTIAVLERLRAEFPERPIKLVWDGASYHRSGVVKARAQDLNMALVPLPGYSPDFMPVEHLWHWLREEVTYHASYDNKADLIAQVERFQQRVNQDPLALSQRLWVTTELDDEIEELRVAT